MKKIPSWFASLALGLAALAPAHANLLANGGFESPGAAYAEVPGGSMFISGWTTILSGVEYLNPASPAALNIGSAFEGVMIVDLANFTFSNGGIEQMFATAPLQQYTLTFAAGNLKAYGRTGDGIVDVQVGSLTTSVSTATDTGGTAVQWKPIALTFTALAPVTTLSFTNMQDSFTHFAFVDGVSVTAVPEPQAVALMLAGLAVVGTVARRRHG